MYRVAGAGTEEFSRMDTGEKLKIVGPLGNGFPFTSDAAFVIGGGIGIPPMLELAKQLSCTKQMILGYRDRLFLEQDFKKYGDVYVATEGVAEAGFRLCSKGTQTAPPAHILQSHPFGSTYQKFRQKSPASI